MRNSLFEFTVEVPGAGYEWKMIEANVPAGTDRFIDSERILVPLESSRTQLYAPMRIPALFRRFADLEPEDTRGLLMFANAYGALGLEGVKYRGLEPEPPWNGECYGFWCDEIQAMKFAVQMWDWAGKRYEKKLSRVVHWQGTDAVTVIPEFPGNEEMRFSSSVVPDLFRRFRPGDVIKPAESYVQGAVNRKLLEHGVVTKLLWDPALTRLVWRVVPNTLIGALWAQLGQAISGGLTFSQCAACANWFEIAEQRRADTKFCSPACRSRAYRRRKRTGAGEK